MGVEVFQTLKKALHDAGHNTNVGDEGGFAPNLQSAEEALELRHEGDRDGRLQARRGRRCWRSIRPQPNSSRTAPMSMKARAKPAPSEEQAKYLAELVSRYPIASIEDGMAEDDFDGWKLRHRPDRQQVPAGRRRPDGDQRQAADRRASSKGIANSILVKVNQIGTLTEALAAVETAHKAGYTAVMSHRSGETEDCHHRRPRGRHQLRADQDRLAGALRPHRQVQPAPAHRAGAGTAGEVSRPRGAEGVSLDLARPRRRMRAERHRRPHPARRRFRHDGGMAHGGQPAEAGRAVLHAVAHVVEARDRDRRGPVDAAETGGTNGRSAPASSARASCRPRVARRASAVIAPNAIR